jgi:hypothetical protein
MLTERPPSCVSPRPVGLEVREDVERVRQVPGEPQVEEAPELGGAVLERVGRAGAAEVRRDRPVGPSGSPELGDERADGDGVEVVGDPVEQRAEHRGDVQVER